MDNICCCFPQVAKVEVIFLVGPNNFCRTCCLKHLLLYVGSAIKNCMQHMHYKMYKDVIDNIHVALKIQKVLVCGLYLNKVKAILGKEK